jgi:hypothetical protein
MKLNWKRFGTTFLLLNLLFLLNGCSANWVGAIQGLMPAISAAISALFSFISALEGKTIPASVQETVQKIEAAITASLQNVQTILATIKQNASASVLAQIEGAFQAIVTNLNSILSGLNVTDPSTVGKVTNLVELAVAAVEAVLALLPLASKSGALNDIELEHADKAATVSIKNTHKVLQHTYHNVVSTDTESAEVNEALAALPQQLP